MSKYTYHPKDQAYFDANGLSGFEYYDDLLEKCMALGKSNAVDGMKEAYRIARSTKEAGILLGVSHQTMSNHLKRMGVELLPRGGDHNKRRAETYQGVPCRKHGHTERYVKSGQCRECQAIYNKNRYKNRR